MNAFYKKLTRFGTLVNTSSHAKNVDMANYFTVVLPAYPVLKDTEQERPDIQFSDGCPEVVEQEIVNLWNTVFGKAS